MAVEETHNRCSALSEEEYGERIARLQQEYLMPLKEDLSDWLNRILDVVDITAENFMSKLDNGVIVCKLAKLIQERCEATQLAFNGKLSAALEEEIPINGAKNSIRIASLPQTKCWETAKSQSFYARDNVSNFLKWCRKFGVRDAVIFESEDLVSHVNARNVVLCLLEIARIACTKHSFSPAPGLVQFEQEIDQIENERDDRDETDGWSDSSLLQDMHYKADMTAAAVGRIASASSLSNASSSADNSVNGSTPTLLTSDLDHKLLKARHVMVRVGGGWTTLSHFLQRHGGDPTQEISADDLLPLDTRATSVSPRRRSHCNQNLVNSCQPQSTPLRRYINSTPVSRRSSLSSPEPWMSASSGYSSCSAGYNNSPPSTLPSVMSTTNSVTPRRRRSSTEAPCRRKASIQRASIGGIMSHEAEIYTAPSSPSARPTSEPIKTRYPNYLQSSQHITNRSNGMNGMNGIVPLIAMPPINMAKQSLFRKPVQRTC